MDSDDSDDSDDGGEVGAIFSNWLKHTPHEPMPALPSSIPVVLRPSTTYAPLTTFNFGSVKHQNTFNANILPTADSIILLINVHGGFVKNPKVLKLRYEGVTLNKYSNAATGQCSYSSTEEDRYAVYAICDTVNKSGIIDVPTILKEGIVHAKMQQQRPSMFPSTMFTRTESSMDRTHTRNIDAKYASTAEYSGKVGEENTFGTSFFEKEYTIDPVHPMGVFLCNNWDTIGGKQMDNLLANPQFIKFMNDKYDPRNRWDPSSHNTLAKQKYYGQYPQLLSYATYCIKTFTSKDLYEFCEEHGKIKINAIDITCSVFDGTVIGENITEALKVERNKQYADMNDPKNENVAKGPKGKKCKSKKCKSKKCKSKKCKSKRSNGSKRGKMSK